MQVNLFKIAIALIVSSAVVIIGMGFVEMILPQILNEHPMLSIAFSVFLVSGVLAMILALTDF